MDPTFTLRDFTSDNEFFSSDFPLPTIQLEIVTRPVCTVSAHVANTYLRSGYICHTDMGLYCGRTLEILSVTGMTFPREKKLPGAGLGSAHIFRSRGHHREHPFECAWKEAYKET